ncbi:MAG: protein phosphatase 2C domain-containing protein [Acidobacteriia bacterium]|nr:protein phosphatase 2C domain-containing protein [Terriglobia bacterium]
MRFLAANAQHIGARHSQQDSFGFADPDDQEFIAHAGFLAIVCDGMGGMEYGDAASRTAVRAFLEAYQRKTPDESIPQALLRSVHEANDQVLSLASSLGLIEGIGTTLVAATLHENSMYFASVGDSGLFHVNESGMRMINRPHIFANVLDAAVARGNLSAEDAANHPERESLTSYIGAQKLEEIDGNTEPFPMEDGDAILLASDGLFKTLELDEMRACCTGSPQAWPEQLVGATIAANREYQDNVTVLSLAFESVKTLGLPQTAPPRTIRRVDPQPSELPRTVKMAPAPEAPPPPAVAEPAAPAPSAPQAWTPQPWTPPVQAAPVAVERKKSGMLIPLVVLVVLAAAGFGGWYYLQHRPGLHQLPNSAPGAQAPHRDPLPPQIINPKDVQPPAQTAPRKEPQ